VRDRLRRPAVDAPTVERDRAVDRDETADGAERGGLAGAVGAEHDRDLALVDPQVDLVEHPDRAVPAGHLGQLEQRGHRRPTSWATGWGAPPRAPELGD